MDDPDSDEEMKEAGPSPFKDDKPGIYDFHGFITHLGAGVHSGHYVCHVKKEGGKWIYFNDDKVVEQAKPPFGMGYMYFFNKRQ